MSTKRGPKVTSIEVARLAGVSQSAVSRVFTPSGSASEAVIEDESRRRPCELVLSHKRRRADAEHRQKPDHRPRRRLPAQPVLCRGRRNASPGRLQEKGYHVLALRGVAHRRRHPTGSCRRSLAHQVDGIVIASVNLSLRPQIRVGASTRSRPCSSTASSPASTTRPSWRTIVAGRARVQPRTSYRSRTSGSERHRRTFERAATLRDREIGFGNGLGEAGLHDRAPMPSATSSRAMSQDASRVRMRDRSDATSARVRLHRPHGLRAACT